MTNLIDKINRSLKQPKFIPATKQELYKLGWTEIDFLLITGDAYVDHPSFGISIIGRILIACGYKVGIITQPNWKDISSIKLLGNPKLACCISSGNMDSMLNLYTSARRLRKKDTFSPGSKTGLRPPRSLTIYSNMVKSAFPKTPIIIGGIEASMRRFTHYDYWKDKILPSILINTKADLLVYGMGEKAIIEAANRLTSNKNLNQIPGTVRFAGKSESEKFYSTIETPTITLPSHEEILLSPGSLLLSHKIIEQEMNPFAGKNLVQFYKERAIISERPSTPLSMSEMDIIYELPFSRLPHPMYSEKIPAYEMIKDSIISIRGCPGGCSFCGLGLHQTKFTSIRSENSIINEAKKLLEKKDFYGTISDIGGPTANAYGNKVTNIKICMKCKRPSCLFPKICNNYYIDENKLLKLLRQVSNIPGINHVFLSSGLRLDIALHQKKLMHDIIKNHVSGHLKVAPEHLNDKVLKLMRKNPADDFYVFLKFFEETTKKLRKKQYIIPYFISNFPGCNNDSSKVIDRFLSKSNWSLQQVQDFIPLPMTIASAMYYESLDYNNNPIKVNKGLKERRFQLNILKKKRKNLKKNVL